MALLEDRTAVFIIRIWCERGDADSALGEWRGSVEHVQTGERRFFRHLEHALAFMQPHLQGIGIDGRQRFWEHIAAAIDPEPGDGAAQETLAVPVTVSPPRPRKRR